MNLALGLLMADEYIFCLQKIVFRFRLMAIVFLRFHFCGIVAPWDWDNIKALLALSDDSLAFMEDVAVPSASVGHSAGCILLSRGRYHDLFPARKQRGCPVISDS